jgi:hypothetical protein
VVVELKDAKLAAMIYIFTVSVLNSPPCYLNSSFIDYAEVFVSINIPVTFVIPPFNDPDGSAVTAVFTDSNANPVPFTMAPDFSSVTLSPTSFSEVGKHAVSIDLVDDAGGKLSKIFYVSVMNKAPYFTVISLPKYKVGLNNVKLITISEITDYERNQITMTFE